MSCPHTELRVSAERKAKRVLKVIKLPIKWQNLESECPFIGPETACGNSAGTAKKAVMDWTEAIKNIGIQTGEEIAIWTRVPTRLHHTSCRQPCRLKALGLQGGIPYEISRDRRS
jgi:hypothetical protein